MKPTLQELEARDLLSVAQRCARAHGVTLEEMFSPCRRVPLPDARRLFYEALTEAGWSAASIGRFVGRHHSSILLALGRLRRCDPDPLARSA